ncbi:nitrate ABC transporter substrate-binding protein [Streptobacillus moniliformis]|uniref:NMT1/THI5 like domain protein n=1 Tax=Streptobacillus moniliformis (strain ATCC 14647 / DSM 12112 / NCTC 10651 / 9901) TaxID=519441 RepID=D1AXD1_STRM9|nr:ABC transporter substrate-binding protein [Streptobacillus moniliformis]ACZ00957.1 NMT1/THI5 like domain protein [Streptobacillus moniliformis DSM 12112]AVL42664.1 nitrate ABC transporter substrate-binding protein [Streptobacillus moniliformis]SQA13903.1 Putative thiamine biosynthesis protein HI_0357 [Streptobacillus moniliformis]
MKKLLVVFLTFILIISCGIKGKDKKIMIVLDWTPNTNHTGLFVAKEKGYFNEYGLDVEIVQPPEGSSTQLIGVGKAQIGISFQDTLAKYFSAKEKLPVTAIATILQHNTSGLVSLKDKNITSFKDLEGKTYGTWEDPIEQAIIKKMMKDDGANFEKVNVIPYSWDVLKALQTDTDATWIFYGWDGIALKNAGLKFNFLDVKIAPELDYYTPVIIANNDFLSNNEDDVINLLKAMEKGYMYAIENTQESVDILLKAAPELDRNLVLESQKWLNTYYIDKDVKWGYIDAKRWNAFYLWLFDNGLLENPIEKDFGFTNKYLGE